MSKELQSYYNEVTNNIEKAAKRSGRKKEDVLLVGVSKNQSVADVLSLYDLGVKTFGENRAQDFENKHMFIKEEIDWHFIGHLQTNKIRDIINKVQLIHSLDSLRLAENINEQGERRDMVVPLLMQINVANEESKHGFTMEEAKEMAEKINKLENIKLQGLMAVAPYVTDPEDNRKYYKKMKELFDEIHNTLGEESNMKDLSMGMTGDYEVAIEEGATMVRVGTGLFGSREYE